MKRLIWILLLLCLTAPALALEGLYYIGEYDGDDFETTMEFANGSVRISKLTHAANTILLPVVEVEPKHFTIQVGDKDIHLFETSPETFLMKVQDDDDLMLGLKKSSTKFPSATWNIPSRGETLQIIDGKFRLETEGRVLEGDAVSLHSDRVGCQALVLVGQHFYELLYFKDLGNLNFLVFQHEERHFLIHPNDANMPSWYPSLIRDERVNSQPDPEGSEDS